MKPYKIVPFILQALAWPFTLAFLNFFVRFEVRGKENLKGIKGPIIFASNHISELDPILIRASLPMLSKHSPMFYVSRKNYLDSIEGLRKHIYGGLFFKAWGAYPSFSGQKDYAVSLRHHIQLLKDGCSLCIFPEGRMSETGTIGEVHGGASFLCYTTNAIVVPAIISGAFQIDMKKILKRKNKIIVELKKPLKRDDLFENIEKPTPEIFRMASRKILIS